ncbi:MAG: sugar kinase [Algicola sp.]|nr:sugar kinase [Algicola sp.]
MKTRRFLVIGGANMDITGSCQNTLLAGDSNPGQVKSAAGGVGRNIAENLARLNNPTSLMTLVGDDIGRSVIQNSCEKAGIDQSNILINHHYCTGTYLSINDHQGGLSVAVADMTIIDQLTPAVLEANKQALLDADEIVIEANLPVDTIQWIADNANGKPLHADAVSVAKVSRLKPILSQLDILKVNRQEAQKLLGIKADDIALAQNLHQLGVKNVLLSLGSQGALLCCNEGGNEGPIIQSAIKTDIVSANGSGDALFAGLISAQKRLKSPAHQLEFAVACATFTLQSADAVNQDLSSAKIKHQFLSHFTLKHFILKQ